LYALNPLCAGFALQTLYALNALITLRTLNALFAGYTLNACRAFRTGGTYLPLNALYTLYTLRSGYSTHIIPALCVHIPDIHIGIDIISVALCADGVR
jgi:hypothetical protein